MNYVRGGGIDAPLGIIRDGTAYVLHRDIRGRVREATTTSGSTALTGVPWPGEVWSVQETTFDPQDTHSWVGSLPIGQKDASGLIYRRHRYYGSVSGQFTQQDPIGLSGGVNLYGYAGGDPVNNSDPSGLYPETGDEYECFWIEGITVTVEGGSGWEGGGYWEWQPGQHRTPPRPNIGLHREGGNIWDVMGLRSARRSRNQSPHTTPAEVFAAGGYEVDADYNRYHGGTETVKMLLPVGLGSQEFIFYNDALVTDGPWGATYNFVNPIPWGSAHWTAVVATNAGHFVTDMAPFFLGERP